MTYPDPHRPSGPRQWPDADSTAELPRIPADGGPPPPPPPRRGPVPASPPRPAPVPRRSPPAPDGGLPRRRTDTGNLPRVGDTGNLPRLPDGTPRYAHPLDAVREKTPPAGYPRVEPQRPVDPRLGGPTTAIPRPRTGPEPRTRPGPPPPPSPPTGRRPPPFRRSRTRKNEDAEGISGGGIASTIGFIVAIIVMVVLVLLALNWLRDQSEKEKYDDYGSETVATAATARYPAAADGS